MFRKDLIYNHRGKRILNLLDQEKSVRLVNMFSSVYIYNVNINQSSEFSYFLNSGFCFYCYANQASVFTYVVNQASVFTPM